MGRNSELLDKTITHDLFGPNALTEPAEIEVPDKYELLECLGRGGFGVVYKARDKTLQRAVALKFLSDARPADLERFRREARFTARLNNPAIVQVYELGECNAQPYIAMQFVDGGSLASAKLSADEVVRAVRDAAAALQHAHEAGIVHRDFKPANVLLDQGGRAYLTDFGIARDIHGPRDATLSREGHLIGTPALMPPEQARGDLPAIDARSDIYALGASLYRLLCGRYPFEHESLVELLHAVIHDEPPLPRSINPSIPRALEAVILQCMRKERSRRYASMARVIADLDAYLAGRPADAEPADWFRKLVGAESRRPAGQSNSDLLHTIGIEVTRELAAWDANLYRVSKNISRFHPQLDAIIDRLQRVLEDHPDFAWARFYRGVALARRGRLDEAVDDMERSIDRLADQAAAQFEMGRLYLSLYLREQSKAHKHFSRVGRDEHLAGSRGRLHQAVVAFKETQRLKQDLPTWQIDYAHAVGLLADQDYDACVARCDRILGQDPDIEQVWKLRGDALRFAGKDPFDSYDQAIRVRRSDYAAQMAKAEAYFQIGRADDARACLRQALEIFPEYGDALAQLGRSYLLEVGQRAEACSVEEIRDLLDKGLAHADEALTHQPDCYDTVVMRAELLIEKARRLAEPSCADAALEALQTAEQLDGCRNRVNYLRAAALVERARLDRSRGVDRSADLQRVLAFADDYGAQVPDNEAWQALLTTARAELEALG